MQRGFQVGLLLLLVQLFQEGVGNIPAVTLAVLGFNVYLYMFPAAPPIKACVSLQQVYKYKEWRRLFLSPLHHVDDWHLYFNMVSFIWKGIKLERRMGGGWFLYLLSVFSLLYGFVYLLLQTLLTKVIEDSDPLASLIDVSSLSVECAVGFSGYSGTTGADSADPQPAEDYTTDSTSDYTESYIAGLTEEEQIELAIRNSLNDRGRTRQREDSSGFHSAEGEGSAEEVRRKRLRRFEKESSNQRRRRRL
eukprot:superscaffoldBa00005338_g20212